MLGLVGLEGLFQRAKWLEEEEAKSNKGMIIALWEKKMCVLKASMLYAYITPSPLVWLGGTGFCWNPWLPVFLEIYKFQVVGYSP